MGNYSPKKKFMATPTLKISLELRKEFFALIKAQKKSAASMQKSLKDLQGLYSDFEKFIKRN
jgi:hypothetical protein